MDRFTQFAAVTADMALEDAGLSEDFENPERVSVFVGTGIGGLDEILRGQESLAAEGPRGLSPFFVPRLLTNLAGGTIAMRIGAQGPNHCLSTACASATHAIGEAYRSLLLGDADVAVAGGTEAPITPLGLAGVMVMKALSRHNEDPTRASRPFDVHRDGFVLSEGAGIVILEELEHAKARGARIYAEMLGYGSTCDAFHLTAPGGKGAERCMQMALEGIEGPVDYLNTHGTSTPIGDTVEIDAIREVFGDRMPHIASTKSQTGHSLGAAGAQEAIYCLLMMQNDFVGESINIENLDEAFADVPIVRKRIDNARLNTVMSNSFGFGGTNACLVFQRHHA